MIESIVTKNEALDLRGRMQEWRKLVRKDLLKDVAQLTVRQARDRVKGTKHGPDLQRWPPRKSGGSWPLMFKSGKMFRGIRKARTGTAEYLAGATTFYAKFHHTGTRRGLEPRPFIGVGFQDAREVGDLIDTFVELRFR